MSDKFKAYGYLEGYDIHDDDLVYDPSEPTLKEKAFVLVLILIPVVFVIGTVLAETR